MAQVRNIVMTTECTAGERRVSGDLRALHRLLTILLDNALQFTPAEGTIKIRTARSNGSVSLSVHNTGQGIRSEDLPHIFERFYRGDPARTRQNGAGLGLAIARSIAQAHGTHIEVENQPGQGATFTVNLPHSTEPRA